MPITAKHPLALRANWPAVLNAALWGAQAVTSLALGRAALLLLDAPAPRLALQLGAWVTERSPSTLHALGVAATIGAFGVVGPSLVRIAPRAVVAVAVVDGLALSLVAVSNLLHAEAGLLATTLALVAALLFVAWGRLSRSPITPHAQIRC
jgi:hypothetical protein